MQCVCVHARVCMCVCVCVCVCVWWGGGGGVLVICILYSEVLLNLTEVFPCFLLSCKAKASVKLAKTGHGPHSSTFVICVVLLLFVLFYVLFVCKCVLPPGDNPIAVNKYIISYHYFLGPFTLLGHLSTSLYDFTYPAHSAYFFLSVDSRTGWWGRQAERWKAISEKEWFCFWWLCMCQ